MQANLRRSVPGYLKRFPILLLERGQRTARQRERNPHNRSPARRAVRPVQRAVPLGPQGEIPAYRLQIIALKVSVGKRFFHLAGKSVGIQEIVVILVRRVDLVEEIRGETLAQGAVDPPGIVLPVIKRLRIEHMPVVSKLFLSLAFVCTAHAQRNGLRRLEREITGYDYFIPGPIFRRLQRKVFPAVRVRRIDETASIQCVPLGKVQQGSQRIRLYELLVVEGILGRVPREGQVQGISGRPDRPHHLRIGVERDQLVFGKLVRGYAPRTGVVLSGVLRVHNEAEASGKNGSAQRNLAEAMPVTVEPLRSIGPHGAEKAVGAALRGNRHHARLGVAVLGGNGSDQHFLLLNGDARNGLPARYPYAVHIIREFLFATAAHKQPRPLRRNHAALQGSHIGDAANREQHQLVAVHHARRPDRVLLDNRAFVLDHDFFQFGARREAEIQFPGIAGVDFHVGYRLGLIPHEGSRHVIRPHRYANDEIVAVYVRSRPKQGPDQHDIGAGKRFARVGVRNDAREFTRVLRQRGGGHDEQNEYGRNAPEQGPSQHVLPPLIGMMCACNAKRFKGSPRRALPCGI